jgi:hypothetical protein
MKKYNQKWHQLFSTRSLPAIITAWSLAFGPTLHLSSAADGDGARQQLVRDIEGYAYRHAEQGKMDTKLVVDLFKDNTVGLGPRDVGSIYESAFTKHADDIKGDLTHWIKEWGGWIATVLLGIAFLFRDAVKASAGRLWDAAVGEVLRRFARARFAQRHALRKHRIDARTKYRKLSIPFRREPLDLGKVFVPLGVHAAARMVSTIDAVKACETHKRIVVLGAPGSGKSVLLKHLMLHYGDGGFELQVPSALTVLIELRRFNELDLANLSVQEQILDALKRNRRSRFLTAPSTVTL